jgi:hypothetical protein
MAIITLVARVRLEWRHRRPHTDAGPLLPPAGHDELL